MTIAPAPLSRLVAVTRLPTEGTPVSVHANDAERSVLAAQYGLAGLDSLSGEFLVRGRHDRVHVTGRVRAEIEQICVVSLDPFRSTVDEPVDVSFEERAAEIPDGLAEYEIDPDEPDPIVDGRIDFGHLTAEFLALALDPYPRKPGVHFDEGHNESGASPFADLARLKSGN